MPGDLIVSSQEREGYAAMSSDGYLVALDTRLTDELVAEGLARDVVRRVNEWRKAAGFRIEDRIRLRYEASERLSAAVEEHAAYIRTETLCVSLESGLRGSGFSAEAEFGGEHLRVEIERADFRRDL
jgi:isoleucyl-tRNA synthetase